MSTIITKQLSETISEELDAVLQEERLAISTLDAPLLKSLATKKLEVLGRLRVSLQGLSNDEQKEIVQRVLGQATANQALLRDTISTMSECLGLKPASVYDQRARILSSPSAQLVRCSI